jgi:hypothetical protein
MLYDTDTKSFAIFVRISGIPSALILTVSARSSEKALSFYRKERGQRRRRGVEGSGGM